MKNNVTKQAYISAIISTFIAICFLFGPAYQIMSVVDSDVKIWQSCYSLAFNGKPKGTNIEKFANYNKPLGEVSYGELFNILFIFLLLFTLIAYFIYLYRNNSKIKKSNFYINCAFLSISIVCVVLTFCSRAFVIGLADKKYVLTSDSNEVKLSLGWGAILSGISLSVTIFSLAVALISSLMKRLSHEIIIHNSNFLDNIDDEDDDESSLFKGFFKKGQNPLLALKKQNNDDEVKENNDNLNNINSTDGEKSDNEDKTSSIEKRLMLLKDMKEKDLITTEEYEKRKEEILNEI